MGGEAAKISALSYKYLLEKHEYLTGEDLGHKSSVLEKVKFKYYPFGNIFNKGLKKKTKWKRRDFQLFKWLQNIESKIEGKNETQLEAIGNQSDMVNKKTEEIVLLKDRLDYIFKNFDLNFTKAGKIFLIKLAKNEDQIDYTNLFFKVDGSPISKSLNFLEKAGTMYDLLIYWFYLAIQNDLLILQHFKPNCLK